MEDVRAGLRGAAAGMIATGVMTAGLLVQLVVTRGELEPKRVTEWFAHRTGRSPSEPVLDVATAVNHLAFGSSAGAVYGVLRARTRRRMPPGPAGAAYGVAVWASSYAGWIPAFGILPPPHRDRRGRAVRIHLAHWLYGLTLGIVEERLARRSTAAADGAPDGGRAGDADRGV